MIELKLKEHNMLRTADLHTIDAHSTVKLGISTFPFATSHSIPDCLGVFFRTPGGNVVHTGDFKFDMSPVNGPYPDLYRMAEIGKQGFICCCPKVRMLNGLDLHPRSEL